MTGNILPEPLQPGQDHRVGPDGETRLWNPDWTTGPSYAQNTAYIEFIIQLAVEQQPQVISNLWHLFLRHSPLLLILARRGIYNFPAETNCGSIFQDIEGQVCGTNN